MSLSRSSNWVSYLLPEQIASAKEARVLLAELRQRATLEPRHPIQIPQSKPAVLTLPEAYDACVAIIERHSRSFYLATQLLPPAKRCAVRAFYAFCRTSDDLVDQAEQNAVSALADWVAQVHAPAAPVDNAVLLAWNDTAARYGIAQGLVDELLAGIAMDLTIDRYETFADLWVYCYRVASVVGLVSMQIVGHEEGATEYAVKLGVALQLTNILRDVGEDAARGRVYLPQEDLARFGLCDDDILSGCLDQRFRRLMQFEIERAYTLYEEAWPGIRLLNADSRLAIGAAAAIYRGILAKISANEYDVFCRRAFVPLPEKLQILAQVWWRL